MWNETTRNHLKMADGSIRDWTRCRRALKKYLPHGVGDSHHGPLIDMAADRGAFIRSESVTESTLSKTRTSGSSPAYVLLRVEEGPEDHLLLTVSSGHAHSEGNG